MIYTLFMPELDAVIIIPTTQRLPFLRINDNRFKWLLTLFSAHAKIRNLHIKFDSLIYKVFLIVYVLKTRHKYNRLF